MRSRALVAMVAAVALLAPTSASAATEVGNNCEAKAFATDRTAVQLQRESTGPLPIAVPAAGVITSWRTAVTLTEQVFPQQLKVLRPAGTSQFAVVAESAPALAGGGINAFPARIPVEAGDLLGVAGNPLYCESSPAGDVVATVAGNAPTGSTQSFADPEAKTLLSLMAVVEPDADRDGYGDETQDLCPISAVRQTACPAPTINAVPIVRKRGGGLLVLVTTTQPVTVTVGATVTLPRTAAARLAPVTAPVAPPTIGRLALKLPAKVKKALAALPRGRSLTLTARITTVDEIGRTSAANRTIKLRSEKRGKAK